MTDADGKGRAVTPSNGGQRAVRAGRGSKVVEIRRDEPAARAPDSKGVAEWQPTSHYTSVLLKARRSRLRRLLAWFGAVVMVPTLITAAYTLWVASPRYTSEFEFTYQTYRNASSLSSGLVQSVIGTSQSNSVDLGAIVYEYLRSSTLATKLDSSLDLRGRFSDRNIDWMSRLAPGSARETMVDYFRSRVQVSQGLGGYVKVDVEAFEPAYAQKLAQAIFDAADGMADDLTLRARKNEVGFAEAELERQSDRVRKARVALTLFQNEHGDQDPSRAATQLGTIVGSIESQLSDLRSQLIGANTTLAPDSPIVKLLKTRIAALEDQLKIEQQRLATKQTDTTPYSKTLEEYAALQVEQEFAKNAYMAAQQGLVVARAEAASKQNYLVDFVSPSLPQERSFTFPIRTTATVFLSALLVFTFGGLVLGAARDQIVG